MRTSRVAAAIVVAMSIGWSSSATAQERKGFWFDFDPGIGSVRVSSNSGSGDSMWGGVGALAAGWALNPRLLAGVEMRLMTLDVSGDIAGTMDVYDVLGRVAYYPYSSRGLFVKGAV